MLKEGSTQNVCALMQNLRETLKNGSSPIHVWESREISSWDCVFPVNVRLLLYVCAGWKPDPNTCMCFMQDGLSKRTHFGEKFIVQLDYYYILLLSEETRKNSKLG
jgi:hypothetical protein